MYKYIGLHQMGLTAGRMMGSVSFPRSCNIINISLSRIGILNDISASQAHSTTIASAVPPISSRSPPRRFIPNRSRSHSRAYHPLYDLLTASITISWHRLRSPLYLQDWGGLQGTGGDSRGQLTAR